MSMFSSFTQFLPSAIQNSITPHASTTVAEERPPPESSFDPTNTDDEGDEEDLIRQQSRRMDDEPVKSKKEKDGSKMVSETFIFVRPPPSKTNHPLNLQVQLVPPSARPPSGVAVPNSRPTTPTSASSIASTTTDGSALARTSSNRSEYSTTYASNSTTSFASYASSSAETTSSTSTSSGRGARRIIPLYNLQAHNVLPNVIADAGTDAKIAKFQKKGLELIDLAVLEPVEVWGMRNKTGEKQAKKQGMRISVDEMGAIVHTGIACRPPPPNTASRAGFLLPKASGSRPGTPSANSSAVSLASTTFSGQHQVTASPRSRLRELAPPASAPPQSAAFPSSQLPKPSQPISITPPAPPEEEAPPEATPPAIVVSTTPTKKGSSSSLFGKLKFNSKRNSALNPLAESPSPTSPPTSPKPPIQAQQSELAKMALTTSSPAVPTTQGRPASLSVPLSPSPMSPQNSDTPTPTQAAPNSQDREDEDPAYDTPVSSPARPAFTNESGGPGQRISSIGGAFTRGRNKLFSGIKGAAASVDDRAGASGAAASSSAKGFFNKLTAGITGERGAQQESTPASGNKRSSGIFSLGRDSLARDSVDANNGAARTTSPFGKMLHHSTSQQYIGSSAASSVNPSPRPSHDANVSNPPPVVTTTAPSVAGSMAAPSTPSQLQSFASAQTPQIQTQQLSLRQLQLRPPVLGIQPTYVSASHSQSQDVSTVNFTVGPNGQPIATVLDEEVQNGGTLSKVESYSSLATEESVTSTSLRKRRSSKTRSNTTGTNSRRTSLNLDRDKDGHLIMPSTPGASVASSTALSGAVTSKEALVPGQGKEKERALMYVWLVAKWLKKRNAPPPSRATSEHESGGGGERPRARDLLRDILPGRDKGNGNGDREAKRGSWHAGAGIGLLPHLGGGHVQQPSNSSVAIGMQGQPLVLGPLVGGGIETRFEWKRAKTKSKGKNKGDGDDKRVRRKEKAVEGTPVKRRDMAKEEESAVDDTPKVAQGADRPNRASTISVGSLAGEGRVVHDSPSRPGSAGSASQRSAGASSGSRRRVSLLLKRKKEEGLEDEVEEDEDEDDSDSEDSETPWVCTLKIRRIGYVQAPGGTATVVDAAVASAPTPSVVGLNGEPASGNGTASGKGEKAEKEQTLRLKVGTLSPTPHHPKVVAMLKVPFPLPDVELERMKFVKRKGAPGEEGSSQNDPYYGLTLTAEDIKDVVCSTGLWLVVRESIGGVGKVRKGDGWKIRG